LPLTPAFGAAVSALLGAAALYALDGVYEARRITGASPVESTIGQQFGAFVLLCRSRWRRRHGHSRQSRRSWRC